MNNGSQILMIIKKVSELNYIESNFVTRKMPFGEGNWACLSLIKSVNLKELAGESLVGSAHDLHAGGLALHGRLSSARMTPRIELGVTSGTLGAPLTTLSTQEKEEEKKFID